MTSSQYASQRILFVGNSLTYWSGGIDAIFRLWGCHAESVTAPGATLADLWKRGAAQRRISSSAWDVVVLQDDLPEYRSRANDSRERWEQLTQGAFGRAAALFEHAVRSSGATPVFFMAHAYRRLPDTRLEDICRAHREVAGSLAAAVAPCGLAHSLAASLASASSIGDSMPLLEPDEEHPSEEGIYLNACWCVAPAHTHPARSSLEALTRGAHCPDRDSPDAAWRGCWAST